MAKLGAIKAEISDNLVAVAGAVTMFVESDVVVPSLVTLITYDVAKAVLSKPPEGFLPSFPYLKYIVSSCLEEGITPKLAERSGFVGKACLSGARNLMNLF